MTARSARQEGKSRKKRDQVKGSSQRLAFKLMVLFSNSLQTPPGHQVHPGKAVRAAMIAHATSAYILTNGGG